MQPFLFSAEEINLMCIFDTSSKDKLIAELRESLYDVYEYEMLEIYDSAISKLEKLSDDEFYEIGLYMADVFDDGEDTNNAG